MSIKWDKHFAERTKHLTGSQIRQFFALTEKPEVISFAGGFPGNEFFPREDIARALSKLAMEDNRQSLQYGPTEGSYDLREQIAERMTREGSPCGVDNLIITDGSQQGLDLLCRILINPDEPVLVEDPAYIGGMSAIKSYGGKPIGIKMDEDGPIPFEMERVINTLIREGRRPKLFYTVPNFQNPSGTTTGLERRNEILKIAYRYNLIILEDNPYGPICFEGEVPPPYISLDREERVLYLGSYSKVLIPGIRIGWLAGAKPLIEKISLAKQTADLCSSSLGQQLASFLSRDGYLDRHIMRLSELYREKRDAMHEAMGSYFPSGVKFNKPKGGFFIWVEFPDYYPTSREILDMALARDVAFVHGEGFSCNGGGKRCARFSFSQPELEDITRGIQILGDILHEIEADCTLKAVGH